MVGDQGPVAVVFAPGNLVHTNIDQGLEACIVKLLGHDAFADRPDGPPRDPGERGDGGLVRTGDQPGDYGLKVHGEPGAGPGERHALDHDTVGQTAQPAAQHRQHGHPACDVQVPPGRFRPTGVVAGHGREVAVRAIQALTGIQRHPQHQRTGSVTGARTNIDWTAADPCQVQDAVE